MIPYDTISAALQAWVAAVTGIPPTSVLVGGAVGVMVARPYAEIDFYVTKKLGVDEVRWATVPAVAGPPIVPAYIVPTVSGLRELSVQVHVVTRDNRPQYSAYYLGEMLLNSLKAPTRLATLQASGISVRQVEGMHVMPVSFSDRLELQAVLDLVVNAVSIYTPADGGESYIEHVVTDGDLKLGSTVVSILNETLP